MKHTGIESSLLRENARIDAKYYLSQANRAKFLIREAGDMKRRALGDFAHVFQPARFKRVYAVDGEDFVPYLRAYDVFEYLPPAADFLSSRRTANLDSYRIRAGDLLQTCSGRNLGPTTIADKYLAQFALSHDMIRIRIEDNDLRYYTLSFLRSHVGQTLIRSDLNGSVIDHVTVEQIKKLCIPIIEPIYDEVVRLTREAWFRVNEARCALQQVLDAINARNPVPPFAPSTGWEVRATSLGTRIDAAPHSKRIQQIRDSLLDNDGVMVAQIASVSKPGGRPKLIYVDENNGVPYLSGRQILQAYPIGLKYLSRTSLPDGGNYALSEGDVVFQADGRAEESLGYPAMVLGKRVGWFASGHVGRFSPRDVKDAGWLWAATASDVVQTQISALACGSVVDSLYEDPLMGVMLPRVEGDESTTVVKAWGLMAKAEELEDAATELINAQMCQLGIDL